MHVLARTRIISAVRVCDECIRTCILSLAREDKTRRAHPHYRARKTGRCSFRTAIIYPGVTDWSLERGRDNVRARKKEKPWTYTRARVRVRVIEPYRRSSD